MLVCLPGKQTPARLDSILTPVLSPREIIAFLRMKDLEEMLAAYPEAPILTTAAYAKYLKGYEILLKGKKGTGRQMKYLLITANPAVTAANVGARKVGILDFLGREKLPAFVQDAFGLQIAKLKRVNKQEDLLNLIGMEAVDAAIVEESALGELRSNTKLSITVLLESKPVDSYPVLAAPGPQGWEALKTALGRESKSVLKTLQIEGWE